MLRGQIYDKPHFKFDEICGQIQAIEKVHTPLIHAERKIYISGGFYVLRLYHPRKRDIFNDR